MATIILPSLKALPTATHATRSLKDVKRRARKHAFRLSNIATSCLFFAWFVSPKRKKHPYLLWVCLSSTLGSFGVDLWFNRNLGLAGWARSVVEDIDVPSLTVKKQKSSNPTTKDEDLVVVESETNLNGESVQREMNTEQRLQVTRAWFSGAALAMGIVGLWGDGA